MTANTVGAKSPNPNRGKAESTSTSAEKASRRDFIEYLFYGGAGVSAALLVYPFVNSMNPAADVRALASIDIGLDGIEKGQSITVQWRGKPVFIRHRTEAEVEEARRDDSGALIDPQRDDERIERPEWLIVVGVCTHLGCIPLGQKTGDPRGDFNGWFCPCHGSHYDTSGRIRKGPAPANLAVPEVAFLSDTRIRIG